MDSSTKLMRNGNLVFRVIDNDGVIYNPATKRLHMLNEIALMAWNLWDGKHTLAEIVDVVVSGYDADAEKVMQDITNCAGELCRHGLLQRL